MAMSLRARFQSVFIFLKARMILLPGACYARVGQLKAARTSVLLYVLCGTGDLSSGDDHRRVLPNPAGRPTADRARACPIGLRS
jgi:hypothetical protein